MTDQASQVTTARSQVDVALAERDALALQLAEARSANTAMHNWNDSLALQLASSQAALADVLAEHTATVAELATVTAHRDAMWPVVDEAVAWRADWITWAYHLASPVDRKLLEVVTAYIEKVSPPEPAP